MTARLFERLGFLIIDDFIESDSRRDLLAELRAADSTPATVYHTDTGFVRKEDLRKTSMLSVSAGSEQVVLGRLLAIMDKVGDHFNVTLEGCQPRSFLRYGPGDFFQIHIDRNRSPDAREEIQRRLISIVLFLNDRADGPEGGPGTYSGGDLAFLTHVGANRDVPFKVPFRGRAGMLVAFPADVPHEVRPVTRGARYTVVSWFE